MNKLLFGLFASVGLASNASAAGPDMTAITSAVDVGTVITAISAIAVIKFGVPFTKWAYSQVTRLFGR